MCHPAGLDEDGNDDEGNAQPEREVHFPEFSEEDGRDGDAVDGFQIVGKVHNESRMSFPDLG